ncbi:MAG: hypothetical protein M3139_14935 [Bacteroidota bacterium]|nr:hypothetical protein [Bacteroidota bacterium]
MKNVKIVIVASVLFFACKASKINSKPILDNTNNTNAKINLPCNRIGDTLQYIQCLLKSKEKYLNEPLNILLNDLKFPVKSYTLGISNSKVTVPGIFLSFDDGETTIDKLERARGQKNPLMFYVTFNPPIDAAEILSKLDTRNSKWGKTQEDYFEKLIVKDLQ